MAMESGDGNGTWPLAMERGPWQWSQFCGKNSHFVTKSLPMDVSEILI
jgi:hypothetical protein